MSNILWTSTEIATATGGTAVGEWVANGVTFDSREVGPGDLFIALEGASTDGHRFVPEVLAKGASGVLVSQPVAGPHVLVADTMAALQALAVAARRRVMGKVIGVTGSVGKTGTKEALFAALDRAAPDHAHRSLKSYNNHTGVPLSLARMPMCRRFGVFEMGMNHAGELAALTRLVRPHVALITAIAPAHTQFFDSIEAIADAKAEIFQGLEPGGIAIVPFDSPYGERLAKAAARHADHVVTFGLGEGADVRALETMRTPGGTFVTARLRGRELGFTINQPGTHWVSNALAVLAAVEAVGADVALAGLALAELGGLPGRGARVTVPLADGGTALLIDESYNANPSSMRATLAVLGAEPARRKLAVLGDMRELGAESARYHADLAEPLIGAGVVQAILVGPEMHALARALEGRLDFVHVPGASEAQAALRQALRDGDAVLVKGSNGVGLARLVAGLEERA
ncbi:MAG: UDP-N-acetylmuramoyl-tripeptide--D-alanyl-D-alanine ligase [Sphingomonas sp.]|nr:UDP-N-acetylmuramoyl-tripeptide--D-alanyl-D-alanine ligase [Sphingomonas sp.]